MFTVKVIDKLPETAQVRRMPSKYDPLYRQLIEIKNGSWLAIEAENHKERTAIAQAVRKYQFPFGVVTKIDVENKNVLYISKEAKERKKRTKGEVTPEGG